jgi:hypothetical protein
MKIRQRDENTYARILHHGFNVNATNRTTIFKSKNENKAKDENTYAMVIHHGFNVNATNRTTVI